ncbi:MAG TPA: acyltransferase [Conexibacter sp.]|nr:acyltransferase [Conexibacter sp.]
MGRFGHLRRYLPPKEFTLNHAVNRIPFITPRMLAYERAGVRFEDAGLSTFMLGTEVWTPERLTVGAHTIVGRDCLLDARGGITIGRNVNITSYSLLMTAKHTLDAPDFIDEYAPIEIHDRAWLALRCTVLGGVTIGEGAVVAAGAVVTRDVAPFTVVGGIPARPVGERSSALTYELHYRPNWL